MTVNRTTLLDLPLPVTGTESGTWGDTTNNGLTQYVDIAIAGMSNLTSANFTTGAVTIETTEGDSSATNISATSAQYAGFRVTSLAQNSTITVGNTGTNPARSYRLINADATYTLTFKATGQTGVTLLPGQSAVVAFNGTDYVIVGMVGAGTATDNAIARFDGTTGEIVQNSVVTIADSTGDISGVGQLNATTVDTTNIEVTNIKAKDGTAAATIADSTGVVTVTAAPVMTALTASQAVFTTAGKALTSNAITGTGNVVMSASPTLTGTIAGASLQLSSLTSGRVTYATTSGLLTDSANLLYSGTDLTVYGITVGRGAGAVSTNTAVGTGALAANTTGLGVVAIGRLAASANTTALYTTAVGEAALRDNTTGGFNTAVGNSSLVFNTTGASNTALGQESLRSNTTASNNTAVGYQAGYSNTTGHVAAAVGTKVLYANTTGVRNVALGGEQAGVQSGALASNTTGGDNIAIGVGALSNNTTASDNIAVGTNTLAANVTGTALVAIGRSALTQNTGSYNTAVGKDSLFSNTTASNNTAVGYQAGYTSITGTQNVLLGYRAGYAATGSYATLLGYEAGYNNTESSAGVVFVGYGAGRANTSGGSNSALGVNALTANTTGASNTALGHQSLQANTTASNNTAVGYQAGYSNTTGAGNTIVGYQAGLSNTTGERSVFIGKDAGRSTTTGGFNTFVGQDAGYLNTTGTHNTYVGAQGSGESMTTGSKNTIIGKYSGNQDGLDIRTSSNYAVISDGDGNRLLSTANGYSLALDGGAVPQSGTGITFPATQSASSNANTLDDYEEGTWTPSVGGNATYSLQDGSYTKIGRMVYLNFDMRISTLGTGSATYISPASLPFPFVSAGSARAAGSINWFQTLAISRTAFYLEIDVNGIYLGSSNGSSNTIDETAAFGNSAGIMASIWYTTNT